MMHFISISNQYILLIFFLFSVTLKAQEHDSNTAHKLYSTALQNKHAFINGREYKPYHLPLHETPYLQSVSGVGTIYMNGTAFSNKTLLYDIFKDELIVNHSHINSLQTYIQLKKSLIDSFTIAFDKKKYTLIHFKNNELGNLNAGFYEQLYHSDQVKLIFQHKAKEGKSEALTTYSYHINKHLVYTNKSVDINSKRKFLSLFPEHKKALKKKISQLNYSYKKLSRYQLIELIKFTESL